MAGGPETPSRRAIALAAALVAALGFLAYSASLSGGFAYDDVPSIVANPDLKDPWRLIRGESLRPPRIVAYATFALNYAFGGARPFGYRLTNVAIHVAAAVLVLALGLLAFRTPRLEGSRLGRHALPISAFAAILFVVHPIQTQAVAYVVQRITSLATCLFLGASVLYVWARLTPWNRRRPFPWLSRYLGALLLTLLAMRTKEISFTLPFALLLAETLFFGPGPARRFALLVPFAATLPVIPWLLFSLSPAAAGGGLVERAAAVTQVQVSMSRWDYLATQATVILRYLGLIVWPAGQNADPEVTVATSFLEPSVLGAVCVLLVIAGIAAALLLRARRGTGDSTGTLVAFGVAWFFLTISVESSIIPIVDMMNEHRVYLPFAGLALSASAGLAMLVQRVVPGRVVAVFAVAGTAATLAFGISTFRRAQVWTSELALWQDTAPKSPRKARPWTNLGAALTEAGRLDDAEVALTHAVTQNPRHADAWFNLGNALLPQPHRADDAAFAYEQAIAVDPSQMGARSNLAALLIRHGRFTDVVSLLQPFSYDSALAPEGHFNLGVALAMTNDFEGARRQMAYLMIARRDLGARLEAIIRDRTSASSP